MSARVNFVIQKKNSELSALWYSARTAHGTAHGTAHVTAHVRGTLKVPRTLKFPER